MKRPGRKNHQDCFVLLPICTTFAGQTLHPHKMKIVIGIDVGISTTKIVGIDQQGTVISPIRIKATDPVTSLYGAFGKYLYVSGIQLDDV